MARKSKKRAKKAGKNSVPPVSSPAEAEASNQDADASEAPTDRSSSSSSSGDGNASEAETTATAPTADSTVQKADSESGVASFIKGTKQELDKVVWPSRQQLISESAAVILMVSLSATLIYLVDSLFSWGSRQVF